MFKSNNKKEVYENKHTATNVICNGTVVECAVFRSNGSVRIDGQCAGEFIIGEMVTVDENGVIEGNISAKRLLAAGTIKGNITCEEEIHLTTTANVDGNIVSSSIIIDEGAVFCGNCLVKKKENVYDVLENKVTPLVLQEDKAN